MSRKLTKDLIRSRIGNDNFGIITTLNLWGNNIDDISLLSKMPLLEIISLNMNHIKDLSVFQYLKNIKELYLQDNKISDFKQIEYLKNCTRLKILCLSDNPISKQQNYVQKIFEILPFLKKLDDIEKNNSDIDKNLSPPRISLPQNPFFLFKKIFPKRQNKLNNKKTDFNYNPLENGKNVQINNQNNIKEDKNKNEEKNDLLNKSFQKKTIGTFRKVGNKKKYINLDLSVDYGKNNILENNNEINDPNKSAFINDFVNNNMEINSRNKYNKKVVGNFKKDQIKNYQTTMRTYQEFDMPVKKEENKKNLNDNNKKNNNNEKIVLQSIRILLDTLNLSELKIVNDDIQKIIKDKNSK